MLFTTKVTTVLLAMAASALAGRSAAVPCHGIDGVDVTLFQGAYYVGDSLTLDNLVEGQCSNLPDRWRGAANSVKISGGVCYMYTYGPDCVGPPTFVKEDATQIKPMTSLRCFKLRD